MKKTIFLFLLYAQPLFSQVTFDRTYSLFQYPQVYFVQPLQNGGYVVSGKCLNASDSTDDFCFLKTDEYGDMVWARQMNDTSIMNYPANEWATTIREKPDGSFVFGGSVKDPGYSYSVAFYGWLDSNGDLISSTSKSSNWTTAVNALLLNNDGTIISTRDDREGAGHHANWIEVNNPSGQFISGSSAGNFSIANQALVKMPDGGYATLAIEEAYYFEPPYNELPLVTRFETDGSIRWQHSMHNEVYSSDTQFTALCATPDTGILICGKLSSGNMIVTKFNSAGDSLWTKTIFTTGASPAAIQQTADGGYAIGGTINNDMMLLKLDANADSMWMHTYSHSSGNSSGIYFQQTTDNGFILLGQSANSGVAEIYLVKTDNNGIITNTNINTGKADPEGVINLFPDPFSSSLNIRFPGNVNCIFSLCDITGRLVYKKEIYGESEQIDFSFLLPGVYYASFSDRAFSKSKLVIKQ